MNTYEMEGFLRGQCVPRDLIVNESNAAYLVRKLSEISSVKAERDALEEKCESLEKQISHVNTQGLEGALKMASAIKDMEWRVNTLAVENAALKDSNRKLINEQQASWPIGLLDSFIDEHDPKTPATDAALAAIRNEATARALKHLCDCQIISATVAELKAE
ncbi:hypothetical protein [Serratia marcescens]|uniref:hypothetical protein n=1 Tax=Serratia marcescens TaxID=615 RepID=UPI00315ADDA6